MSLNGLTTVNVELTSICNKNCWMCGRRKIDKEYPELAFNYGNMNFELVEKIASELPSGIVVQLHNNGEPTMYPYLEKAIKLFNRQITNFVTNGKLLMEKADEIIGNLDTMAVSVIENDPDGDEQYDVLCRFLEIKKDRKPHTILRLNGDIDNVERYEKLGLVCARRILHAPEGSFNYKKDPTIPEIGICLDFLNHLAINKDGIASICVRFDPKRLGVIGDVNKQSISEIWNSSKRKEWLDYHKTGERNKVPLCSLCQFWGVPTGKNSNKIKHINNKIY